MKVESISKEWRDAGSFADQMNLFGFWDEGAFLTKSGDLGSALRLSGVDFESLDHAGRDYAVKRLEAALRSLDVQCRLYQIFFKCNRPTIAAGHYENPLVRTAVAERMAFLAAKAERLYRMEIYDVGQAGDTQKPFGRIFYTKDRSLIFYGYDLDQQRGVKKDASFQAWGRREGDRKPDVSLGVFYQDDAGNKRWILKFNDPSLLEQLDAVFITAEPRGGSPKPSGKPILFTYLRIDANHP